MGTNSLLTLLLAGGSTLLTCPHDLELVPDALEHVAARLEEALVVGVLGPLIAHREPSATTKRR